MKALLFAAGRGTRMGELTRYRPKPLLEVAGRPLIAHAVARLRDAGIDDLVINIAYRGEQVADCLGDGAELGVTIRYSREPFPLETGGAIVQALPLLGEAPFVAVNADVWSDFPFGNLLAEPLPARQLGRLVMVPNPSHVPEGDFHLDAAGLLHRQPSPRRTGLTYSGIGLLRPELVSNYPRRRRVFPLVEAFREAAAAERLGGLRYDGEWRDIGTPERLEALRASLPD